MQDWLSAHHLQQYIFAIILLMVGFVVAQKVAQITEKYSNKRFSKHHAILMKRLVYYLIFTAFVISSLQQIGFKLTVLIGAAGVLTVALSFASQTAASNLISGIFLIFERPFSIDDFIELKGFSGTVIAMDLLSTKLKTVDNRVVRIPNETMIKSEIINYNTFKTRRIDLLVDIGYENNIEQARALLLDIAGKNCAILKVPAPNIWVNALADSSVQLKLMVWVESSNYGSTKSALQENIKHQFDLNHINIPYPQITVHRAEA